MEDRIYQQKSRRELLELNRSQLFNERNSFIPQWRDIGDYLLPRRPRFNVQDNNKGDRRNQRIIDSSASFALRTLRSGMQAGITSPARPWFRVTIADKDLVENESIKRWLYVVTDRMTMVLLKSNFYNCSPNVYGDLGGFGTAALLVEQDMESTVRFYNIAVGSFMIANDDKLRVRNFCRDLQFTVAQLVEKFGHTDSSDPVKIDWTKFSDRVQNAYREGRTQDWVEVCHQILPNPDYEPNKLDSKFKRYLSVYYERNSQSSAGMREDVFLREAGYSYFPVLTPRWETSGEDVYGTNCPGMEAVGDIRALQTMQRRKAQAIEKMVNPPMIAGTNMKNRKTSTLPGDTTYVDGNSGASGFAPAYQVQPRVQELVYDIQDVRQIIRRAFYEDLFLMIAQSDGQKTATEIMERKEEKLLAVGPVLEQLNQDMLDPLIGILFAEMFEQNLIPEAPQEIQGQDLKVEYISVMAQAQKLVGIGTLERFLGFAGQIISVNPGSMDKIDFDQAIDVYGEFLSVPPGIIKSDEAVDEIRAQRAEAQQAASKMQALQSMAGTAKDLSQANMEGDNALNRMVQGSQAEA